jgi:hypothetical protein
MSKPEDSLRARHAAAAPLLIARLKERIAECRHGGDPATSQATCPRCAGDLVAIAAAEGVTPPADEAAAEFRFRDWGFFEALDALVNRETDDFELAFAVVAHLRGLGLCQQHRALAAAARRLVAEQRVAQGYGLADVVMLADWLRSHGIHV